MGGLFLLGGKSYPINKAHPSISPEIMLKENTFLMTRVQGHKGDFMTLGHRNTACSLAIILAMSVLLAACTNYNRQRGVENTWRSIDQSELMPGTTTQMDIAKVLGPPSQVINLKAGPVFYYLAEKTKGSGLVLIVFNTLEEKVTYDRAVFFFDQDGILIDYSLSKETIDDGKS